MKPARAVCFDLDATLLDGSVMGDVIARSCGRIAANHAGLDAARLAEANGDAWRSYWPQVEHEWMLGGLSGESVILEVWRRALRACGCGDASLAARALRIHQQEERQAYRPFDDVHDVIGEIPGVQWSAFTSGAFDMVLLVRVTDVSALRDVVLVQLHGLKYVRSSQTVFVLDEEDADWTRSVLGGG